MKEFRISKSRDEIVKLIKKKFEAENLMTIWQKDPVTGERLFNADVQFNTIDPFEGIFSVVIEEGEKERFRSDIETYFLLNKQDFLFKTKMAISQPKNKSIMNFKIPYDVRLKELRINPRVYVPTSEKRYVSAIFAGKNENEAFLNVSCPIHSISKSGICIIVSKETLSAIKLNSVIEIEGVGFFESLANEQKAIIKNAWVYSKKNLSSDEQYALGLEFQGLS